MSSSRTSVFYYILLVNVCASALVHIFDPWLGCLFDAPCFKRRGVTLMLNSGQRDSKSTTLPMTVRVAVNSQK